MTNLITITNVINTVYIMLALYFTFLVIQYVYKFYSFCRFYKVENEIKKLHNNLTLEHIKTRQEELKLRNYNLEQIKKGSQPK